MSMFLDPPGVPDHPLFQGVDLDHLKRFGQDLRNYLLMHAAFKKLIDAGLHYGHNGDRQAWKLRQQAKLCANLSPAVRLRSAFLPSASKMRL